METIKFDQLESLVYNENLNGIVLLNVTGDLDNWTTKFSKELVKQGISKTDDPNIIYSGVYSIGTDIDRSDVVLVIKNSAPINVKKLELWKPNYFSLIYLTDYLVDFKSFYMPENLIRQITLNRNERIGSLILEKGTKLFFKIGRYNA